MTRTDYRDLRGEGFDKEGRGMIGFLAGETNGGCVLV